MSLTTPIPEEPSTLFLGDLSVYCTEKDIRKLFRPFGPIESIRVKRGSSNKTNLSYGFIKFTFPESAEQAIKHLNGIMFLGRSLKIGWAAGKNNKVIHLKDENVKTAQVHVSFISKQIDVLITEATLRGLFSMYGEVVDVALKKSQFDRNLRIQNGYGFIHYPLTEAGVRAAITAVQSLHQVTVDKVTYDCSVSHALEDFLGPQYVEDNPGAIPLNDHGFCLPGVGEIPRGIPINVPIHIPSNARSPSDGHGISNERKFVPRDSQYSPPNSMSSPVVMNNQPPSMPNIAMSILPPPPQAIPFGAMIGRPPLHPHMHPPMAPLAPMPGPIPIAFTSADRPFLDIPIPVPIHIPSNDSYEIIPPSVTARSSFTSQESYSPSSHSSRNENMNHYDNYNNNNMNQNNKLKASPSSVLNPYNNNNNGTSPMGLSAGNQGYYPVNNSMPLVSPTVSTSVASIFDSNRNFYF